MFVKKLLFSVLFVGGSLLLALFALGGESRQASEDDSQSVGSNEVLNDVSTSWQESDLAAGRVNGLSVQSFYERKVPDGTRYCFSGTAEDEDNKHGPAGDVYVYAGFYIPKDSTVMVYVIEKAFIGDWDQGNVFQHSADFKENPDSFAGMQRLLFNYQSSVNTEEYIEHDLELSTNPVEDSYTRDPCWNQENSELAEAIEEAL